MVCSFCKSDDPKTGKSHNVRTCPYLKAAILTFIGYKGATMTQDGFFKACLSFGLDICLTGGMASIGMAMYEAYDACTKALDVKNLLTLTKREQAKALLSTGYFGKAAMEQADAAAGDLVD